MCIQRDLVKSTTWGPHAATCHDWRGEPVGRRGGLGRGGAVVVAHRAGRGAGTSRGEGKGPVGEQGSQLAGGGDMGAWRRWQAGVQELAPRGEGSSQWASRGASWQAGGTGARGGGGRPGTPGGRNSRGEGPRSVRPGTAVSRAGWRPPLGEEGSQLAGGEGDGRWARCQLAPRSGRHEKIKVVHRPGPCGESIKRRPGTRVKVPEACLEAI